MKKILVWGILITFCSLTPVFAENARVLPARAFRFGISPRFTFARAYYNFDRKYTEFQKNEGTFQTVNMGFSAAYGINDWLTALVRWVPGWNLWSRVDRIFEPSDTVLWEGFYDIFTEFKLLLIGQRGLIKTDRFRLTLAPQIKIPLPGPNYREQAARSLRGEPIVMRNLDRHVFGLGGRVYFDVIINNMFYINVFGDGVFYPFMGRLTEAGLYEYLHSGNPVIAQDLRVRYLGDLNFETEPRFEKALGRGIIFSAGLPLRYTLDCGIWYYSTLPNRSVQYQLSLRPNITLFLMKLPLPLAFTFGYSLPLWGRDTEAVHSLSLLMTVFIPGR